MTTRRNPDGTIDVRVVLTVRIDPAAWAEGMMGVDPAEVLVTDIRQDVKRRVRNKIDDWPMSGADYDQEMAVPISDVSAQGVY